MILSSVEEVLKFLCKEGTRKKKGEWMDLTLIKIKSKHSIGRSPR